MKIKLLLIIALLSSTLGFTKELPKNCFGSFGGEMAAYTIELNGESVNIQKHDIFITIKASELIYSGGHLKLTGTYTVFKQSRNEYVIKAILTNGKSVAYEMDFVWNKKKDSIFITAKNGQSEAYLERLDD